ncbi:MAG: glycosyltransferase family 4 protein [Hyphomicrobiales bacterium]|nr:glycosyltransferase family 4 protein [Hyphomicrobiales bacterium]
MRLAVNARVTAFSMGGQQRVTAEILKRLGAVDSVAPSRPLGGVRGHAWEQFALPMLTAGKLLWSPSATGPVVKRDQVVTLHDVAFLDHPEYFSANFVRAYRAILPPLVKRAAKVVTVSKFSRRRIAEAYGLDEDSIEVIGNGVGSQFRRYDRTEIDATRAALDLPARYILLQATSDRRKNLAGALAAWARALPRLPDDLHLVVSGNLARAHVFGDHGPIGDAPRAKLVGFVADEHMGPLMAGAETFLFPSIYEGFGLPIVEAMACGAPVITSAATATQEIAGNDALLVDPMSAEAIAQAIVRLAHDAALRSDLSARGVTRASQFSWDAAAERYRELFRSLGAEL